jgi:hypothetical protein
MLKTLFALALLFVASPAQAAWNSFNGYNSVAGLHGWHVAKLGGGGFVTGGCIFGDNNKAIRTDVFGGYQKTGTNPWVQYVTDTTMPSALVIVAGGQGVYEIACSPSNSNSAVMIYDGYLLYTTNLLCVSAGQSCATWTTEANFTQLADTYPNGGNDRLWGHFVRGDPASANLYVIGTPSEGVFLYNRSTNTVTAVSHASVPVAGSAPSGSNSATTVVDYDPTSSTSGGYTHGIAACPYAKNVYLSTDGGSTWAVSNGGTAPTLCSYAIYTSLGDLWVTTNESNGKNIYKLPHGSSTWVNFDLSSLNPNEFGQPSYDPTHCTSSTACNIVFSDGADYIISTNNGANGVVGDFTTNFNTVVGVTSVDIPWLNCTAGVGTCPISQSGLQFDSNGLAWNWIGAGVLTSNPPTTRTNYNFTDVSAGIEEVVGQVIISPPGHNTVSLGEDFAVWNGLNATTYPSSYCPSTFITETTSVAYAVANPNVIVTVATSFGTDNSSISTNGGVTCSPFAQLPAQVSSGSYVGGFSDATDSNHILWTVGLGGVPYCSSDGGASWVDQTTNGLPSGAGWSNGSLITIHQKLVAADTVNASTFYVYNFDPTNGGLWVSVNNCTSWHKVLSAALDLSNVGEFNSQLKAAYGVAGRLYFSYGRQNPPHPATGNDSYFYEIDVNLSAFTATATQIPNIAEVWDFDTGKPLSGSEPCLFFYGWLSGTLGDWRTCDHSVSYTQLSNGFPLSIDTVAGVGADRNTAGVMYHGMQGSGFQVYLPYLLNRDLDPASNDNSPAFLRKVA